MQGRKERGNDNLAGRKFRRGHFGAGDRARGRYEKRRKRESEEEGMGTVDN